jgi:dienelactone hydrolase
MTIQTRPGKFVAVACRAGCVVAALAFGGVVGSGPAPAAGAVTGHDILIPASVGGVSMHAKLFLPAGSGPFPLAVVNHGSEEDSWGRATMNMPSFPGITDWFLSRGYAVVLPLRPGNGETGGPYLEAQGQCANADFLKAGNGTADSIAAAIAYMVKQPHIRPAGVIVVGNSAGGWGALALASRNPPGVAAVIAFAPGRGGHQYNRPNDNCSPERLVASAAAFGKTARIPSLWLYAANDTYFPPDLSRRLADAYRDAGGKVEYNLLPPVGREGHGLIMADGAATWAPYLEGFLASLDLHP